MSQESLDVTRGYFASRTRGDRDWLELVSPEFVMDYSRRLIDPFVLRGLDDPMFKARGREQFDAWERPPAMEPEELIDAGDKVLAFLRVSGRCRTSGAEVDVHVAHVLTFRDGLAIEDAYFGEDRAAALEAVGLAE
jgi:ketosteroid isomerase-like protein